jgi:hypothetical protein
MEFFLEIRSSVKKGAIHAGQLETAYDDDDVESFARMY